MSIHIWTCSLLATLSLVSYIAQLRNLQARKYRTSPSLSYLVFNIFSAAEQANMSHWHSGQAAKLAKSCQDTYFRGARLWKCIFEMTIVWMIFSLAQFMTSVAFSSRSFRQKILLMVSYGLYALFIFIPFLFGNSRRTMAEVYTTDLPSLLFYVNPSLLYLGYSTFFKRGPTMPEPASVSQSLWNLAGFASQAVVHGILVFFWAIKARPWSTPFTTLIWPAWIFLYNFLLWPLVDHAVMIGIQGRLLWISIKGGNVVPRESQMKARDKGKEATTAETV